MFTKFNQHISQNLSFLKGAKLLLAVSGGVDSVVLTHLCFQLKLNISLAHCNFNLREKESDADEQFVLNLADSLHTEAFVQHFDTQHYATKHKCSIQMAARELRYNWFAELAQQLNYDYILTAHHADDNLETFIINFTRGTGLNGLTGIPILNDNVARPLLPFSRVEIENYAKTHNIQWREDSSNSNRKYLRNKLRHQVIPILKDINPQLLDSFQHTLNHLNDTADIVTESKNAVAKRAIVNADALSTTYKISEFKKLNNPKAYLFEFFKDYGFTQWEDILHLLNAESGKYVQSSSHQLQKFREFLILTPLESNNFNADKKTLIIIPKGETEITTPIGTLSLQPTTAPKNNSTFCIYIDAKKIKHPLQLRSWKSTDRFQPLGMRGQSKLLSKFLKDEKLTPIQKNQVLVLTSNNEVVWVLGLRADERFKITPQTQSILKIEMR